MKTYYAVHDDKTHVKVGSPEDFAARFSTTHWALVQADSDGWIPHTGDECPLPEDARCEYKMRDGDLSSDRARHLRWSHQGINCDADIVAYHPILAEPIPAPQYDPRSVSFNLLDRLKAAHAQAQTIPDLEAELREVLGGMGYDLVARNPFVEPEDQDHDAAVKDVLIYGTSVMKNGKHVPLKDFYVEPTDDMSDWRNWRDNDLIMLKDGIKSGNAIIAGEKYQITHKTKDGFWIDTKMQGSIHIRGRVGDFRFHSRPAKGEK